MAGPIDRLDLLIFLSLATLPCTAADAGQRQYYKQN